MKVSIKRWSSDGETFRSREREKERERETRVAGQILFCAVAVAARFPVFERTNVLLHPLGVAASSRKPVIYKGHKGGISKRNWTCVLFPTEGRFHSRDMLLKTISNFVACRSRRMPRTKRRAYRQRWRKKRDIRAVYRRSIAMNQFQEMCARCSLDHNRTRVHVIFFRRGRSRGHNTVNCYLELADKSQYTPSLIWHNWNRLPQNSLTTISV